MKIKENIQPRFKNKILFLVFIIYLSIPVSGYVYNFQEYSVWYRVECVFKPIVNTNKRYYLFHTKRFQSYKKQGSNRFLVSCNKYSLIYLTHQIRITHIQQTIICYSIRKVRLYPSNKYHNDSDDNELRITECIS
jgi:hypothetical protein